MASSDDDSPYQLRRRLARDNTACYHGYSFKLHDGGGSIEPNRGSSIVMNEMGVHLGEFIERFRIALPRRRLSQCGHPAAQALAHLPNEEGAE